MKNKKNSIVELIDDYVQKAAGRILDVSNPMQTEINMAVLTAAQEIMRTVAAHVDQERDERNYAIEGTIKRLQKASVRTREAWVRDQIRLAQRTLQRLVEPAPAETEPIDIFDI